MSTFLIACGGTGGHLAPGIALAERLTEAGHHCRLIVSQKQVDERLAAKYRQLAFERLPAAPLLPSPVGLARFCWQGLRGALQALALVQRHRPAAIIAFGGFTTTSLALAGALTGTPLALHEANRQPGKAVRWLRRLARRVYLPTGVRLPGVAECRVRYPGYPLRREIARMDRQQARERLGLGEITGPLVAVLGGSQGAQALNEWAEGAFAKLAPAGVSLYCLTGLGKGRTGVDRLVDRHGHPVAAHYVPFSDQMEAVMSAADLVVARAGAGTIAELTACQTPSLLVPYPHAADNHQLANARFFERQGGGLVIEQRDLTRLTHEVADLLAKPYLLLKLRENLRRLNTFDSADALVRDLEEMLDEQRAGATQPRRALPVSRLASSVVATPTANTANAKGVLA